MLGILLNLRQTDAPRHLKAITDQLDHYAQTDTLISPEELFRLCLNPKPFQLFFAEYLARNIPPKEAIAPRESAQEIIDKKISRGEFLDTLPQQHRRHDSTFPMTMAQFDRAAAGMMDPHIQKTALLLQAGSDLYFDQVSDLLKDQYGLSLKTNEGAFVLSGLSVNKRAAGFWRDFMPFLAHDIQTTQTSCPFHNSFNMARNNQGFRSLLLTADDNIRPADCPAQHMIKHLLNTNFIEQDDGTLTIAPNPRPGALPAFIYNKLQNAHQSACPHLTSLTPA